MARIESDMPKMLIVDDDPSVARKLTDQCALMAFQRQAEATNIEIRSRSRVLLVDDDDSVSRFVASRLYDLGIEPSVASDAKMGFFKARREHPSVIVVDYVMPNGDAEYLLTRLRHCPETSRIPVIVHSTHALDGPIAFRLRREIAGHPGAARIVRKSLHAQELVEALKNFCCFVTDPAQSRE